MKNKFLILCSLFTFISACSTTTVQKENSEAKEIKSVLKTEQTKVISEKKETSVPETYKAIVFPKYEYKTPNPADYRVVISDSITGYIVSDSTLPLAAFSVIFKEESNSENTAEAAVLELLSGMYRKGGTKNLSADAIDDSLEFISAKISGSISSKYSDFSVASLSRDFYNTALLAKEIFTNPAFEGKKLETQKAAFINASEHKYDTPSAILSALRTKVNYKKNNRLLNPNKQEYERVTDADLKKYGADKFKSGRIIFAFAGDLPKDSVYAFLKKYFETWPLKNQKENSVADYSFLNKSGFYAVEKEITQANISLNQPFLKRPHKDYYPAVVASFILGGGGFSSRLTTKVRSENGLAYSIYSNVGNSYKDSTLITIALQTKAESTPFALQLIKEEIERMKNEEVSEEELELAKKTLIESLPSMFSTPKDIAFIFAENEFEGKSMNHFQEYIEEINNVTAKQVQEMIRKYFDWSKMTISIVGPKKAFESFENIQVLSLDSLEFR